MGNYGLNEKVSEEVSEIFSKMNSALNDLCDISEDDATKFPELFRGEPRLNEAYLFDKPFGEEMYEWWYVVDALAEGIYYDLEELPNSDIDYTISVGLHVLLDGVTAISNLDVDRDRIARALPVGREGDFNPFRVYGFEELADKLRVFVEAFDATR